MYCHWGVDLFAHAVSLVYQHMKTLKNLWAGNVEDEDENEGSLFFYMMNPIQQNISCEHLPYPVTSSVSE